MTLAGVHVKTIGEGIIDVDAAGIAASSRAIAVGTQFKVFLFDITSGEAIRSFGEEGLAEGKLKRCSGLRFTPDGNHILIAEWLNDRLSLFTFAGVFVRCIGSGTLKSPYDVDFAPNGNLLVADRDNHRICVFAPDGFTLLRCFGGDGATAGQFRYPTALALHASQLYVLDRDSGRVQVFN